MTKLTEEYVLFHLLRHLELGRVNDYRLFVQNAYIYRWESDLFVITKAGLTTEYEIKLSVADFKNDAKKNSLPVGAKCRDEENTKYYHYKKGNGSNYFYYVVPESIADKIEVPEWAGLISFVEHENILSFGEEKKATKLHKEKASHSIYRDMVCKLNRKVYRMLKDRNA